MEWNKWYVHGKDFVFYDIHRIVHCIVHCTLYIRTFIHFVQVHLNPVHVCFAFEGSATRERASNKQRKGGRREGRIL